MKVLLIQSYLGGKEPLVFPIGLACLHTALRGHEVRVFDTNTSEKPFEELRTLCAGFMPDVTGISLRNIDSTNKRNVIFYYPFFKDTVSAVKTSCKAKIVAGGAGFSMFAREILADEPGIDYGIHLEGEIAFPALLQNIENPERVKSVYYRKDGQVMFSGPAPGCDISAFDAPDRSLFAILAYGRHRDAIGVETKRGCNLNCVYCAYGFLNGKNYRLRKPAAIAEEIERLALGGTKRFMFVDSVFNIPLPHAEEICRQMIAKKLTVKWSAWFSEKNLSAGFLDLALRAGCDHVILSPDGFSDRTLQALGKNVTNADIQAANQMLRECDGYEISYNFFKNPPGQHIGNFLSMALFCLQSRLRLGKRVHFEFSSLRIEPHTKLRDIAIKEGLIREDDNLLEPRYYSNRKTAYIEKIFNLALRLKGK